MRFLSDFFSWLKSKFTGSKQIVSEIADLENMFRELIGDAAVNPMPTESGITYDTAETEANESMSVPASEGAANEKTTTAKDSGLQFSITEASVVDLSLDQELIERINKSNKSAITVMRDYIFEKLGGRDIELSDGITAIVDKSDAQHIANSTRNIAEKARISEIEKIIKNAKFYNEVDANHNKFNHFRYYELPVKYNDDIVFVTLNVGKSKTDSVYHIYDLTAPKERNTPNRINGFGRPVGNALGKGVSNNKIPESQQNVKEKSSNQNKTKQKQLEIIKKTNPMWDDYHTGIRTVDDIRTWEEVLELNDESEGQFVWGDFSREEAEQALKDGTITVYSSYPIENGVFVSTSYIQAEEYAGGRGGKVYSKTIPITNVAWINGDEGQYAKVNNDLSLSVPASEGEAVTSKSLFDKVQKGEITYEEFERLVNEGWSEAGKTYGIKPDGEMVTENNKPANVPNKVAPGKTVRRFVRNVLEANYSILCKKRAGFGSFCF